LQYAQIALVQMAPQPAEAAIMQPLDYENYAAQEALKVGIDSQRFTATLQCESGFDPNALGDQGTSVGIAQIHLPAHPDVSHENALDPIWSIDWAATNFAKDPEMWSCYKKLYG
jgi:hypothetical protein